MSEEKIEIKERIEVADKKKHGTSKMDTEELILLKEFLLMYLLK